MNLVSVILLAMVSASWGEIIEISEQKVLRKFLRTHKNVLIFYQETARSGKDWLPVLRDAATEIEGKGSIININCKSSKKLCKNMKVNPSPIVLKHYKDGKFHKDYDRAPSTKSLSRFMEDPTGEMPWVEDQTAHSVAHVETEKDLVRLVTKEAKPILIMFYAPWCGYCKRLKPEFAKAAIDLKQEAVLAGMDVDKPELMGIRQNFNITGFPTIFYIRQGRVMFKYGGENTKDGIVSWMRNPQPPKEPEEEKKWADEDGAEDVHFLTTDTFDAFLKKESSVLVMFYAPWCGHCKAMKPSFNEVALKMKKEGIPGALAAVDATKESSLAEKFKVKGFPTVKYFRNGEFAFEFNERTSEKLLEFMKDPKEPPPPPPPEKPWSEEESEVNHLMTDNFLQFLRKKKHVLVMFYAPWCGHCKKAKPEFTRAAEVLKEDRKVSFAAVDCTTSSELCTSEGVNGFPTFNFYNYGRRSEKGYTLDREEEDFVAFMRNPENPKPGQKRHWKGVSGAQDIVFLGGDNFDDELREKEAFVKFYAPWCGHCKKMKPAFAELAGLVKNTLPGVIVGAIDATKDEELAARFEVKGYPTLLYVKSDGTHEKYRGARTVEDMLSYIQSKRLKEEEPKEEEQEKERQKQEEERRKQEQAEKQKHEAEKKKQKELEEQRKKEAEENKRKELEEQKKKQKELEEQRRKEAEENKRKELEEQKKKEAEKKRQKELEEQKKKEAEKKRQKELEEQRKKEAEKKRQKELEEQRKKEAEKKRQKELEEQRKKEAEKKRQKALEEQKKKEAEKKRQKELEEQRKKEAEKKRQKELEEQRKKEAEKKRQKELEEQRRKEAEKKRQKELEEQRKKEAEKKRQKELEEQRKKEAEKKRQKELEEQRKKEAEKKRQKELEEQRKEAEKKKQKELEEQRRKEAEMKRQKELEEQRKKEAEKKRQKELEEQRKKEARKKRQKELEEQRKKEAEKKRHKDSSSSKDAKTHSHSHASKKGKQEL